MYHYHSTEVSGAAAGSASWTSLFKHQPDVLSSCRKKCYLSFRDLYIFYQDSESWLLFFVEFSRPGPSFLEAIKASSCLNCSELGTNIWSLTVLRCPLKTYSWQHADRWIALSKVYTAVQWRLLYKLSSLGRDLLHHVLVTSLWRLRLTCKWAGATAFHFSAESFLQKDRRIVWNLSFKRHSISNPANIMQNKFWPYPKVISCLFPMLLLSAAEAIELYSSTPTAEHKTRTKGRRDRRLSQLLHCTQQRILVPWTDEATEKNLSLLQLCCLE